MRKSILLYGSKRFFKKSGVGKKIVHYYFRYHDDILHANDVLRQSVDKAVLELYVGEYSEIQARDYVDLRSHCGNYVFNLFVGQYRCGLYFIGKL